MANGRSELPDAAILREWAADLGFAHFGVADAAGFDGSAQLSAWLAAGCHGQMQYMARDPNKRAHPSQLRPGTVSALMVGMNYAPVAESNPDWVNRAWRQLDDGRCAYVSLYARGRDYHKRVRRQLQHLADRIERAIGPFGYRAFCDSAPVMEVALAERSGVGWRGKHTLMMNREQGSWFFLGTLLTDLPLAPDEPGSAHCGSCRACIDACPTGAIVAPYRLDARRCISYLTIELQDSIPVSLRELIGNRIYGCDDCQLACPWNKYAQICADPDFSARHQLDAASLVDLFAWTEQQFDQRMRGSAIRRIGYQRWLRNIAVALGNLTVESDGAPVCAQARHMLQSRREQVSPMVREHIDWAITRLAG